MKDEFEALSGVDCRVNATKWMLILAALVFGVAVFVR